MGTATEISLQMMEKSKHLTGFLGLTQETERRPSLFSIVLYHEGEKLTGKRIRDAKAHSGWCQMKIGPEVIFMHLWKEQG